MNQEESVNICNNRLNCFKSRTQGSFKFMWSQVWTTTTFQGLSSKHNFIISSAARTALQQQLVLVLGEESYLFRRVKSVGSNSKEGDYSKTPKAPITFESIHSSGVTHCYYVPVFNSCYTGPTWNSGIFWHMFHEWWQLALHFKA